jgi:5-(carboxyamino)imidazole ribonucleotide synthase
MVNQLVLKAFQDVIYENIEKILGWNGVTPHIYGKHTFRKRDM